MSDTQTTPNSAPVTTESQATTEKKDLQSTAAPAAQQGSKSNNPAQKAADEVLKTMGKDASTEEVDDVEDDGSDLEAEAKQAEKELKKLRKKLKVGGKEIEVDEDELVKRAQMGYSAEEKWQEAAKMRKQIESFIGMLQKDPANALEKLGFNVDELAEQRIQQRIEEMKKSPEQLELERLRRERDQIMEERERERNEIQAREIERMQNEFAVQIENEITQALDSPDFGLPKSPYFVKRIADVMIYGLKNKKDISATEAAKIVRDEVKTELQSMYDMSPDEVFEQLVGRDRLNKYRRSKIKKTKTVPNSEVKATGTKEINQAKADQKPASKVSYKDFFKNLGTK